MLVKSLFRKSFSPGKKTYYIVISISDVVHCKTHQIMGSVTASLMFQLVNYDINWQYQNLMILCRSEKNFS